MYQQQVREEDKAEDLSVACLLQSSMTFQTCTEKTLCPVSELSGVPFMVSPQAQAFLWFLVLFL
jgi:hypothetical protein